MSLYTQIAMSGPEIPKGFSPVACPLPRTGRHFTPWLSGCYVVERRTDLICVPMIILHSKSHHHSFALSFGHAVSWT